MREQYELLADMAAQPNVSLRVLLFGAGAHQAMGFPFQIFEFVDDDPHRVCVELLSRREILESAEEVGRYRAARVRRLVDRTGCGRLHMRPVRHPRRVPGKTGVGAPSTGRWPSSAGSTSTPGSTPPNCPSPT
jgi:hypothetical protein